MCMYIKRIFLVKMGWYRKGQVVNGSNMQRGVTVTTMQQRCWCPSPDKETLQNLFWRTSISAKYPPPSLPTPTYPTNPTSSCLTLGFWLSPDQTPVNNTGQVTPSRLAFIVFFFSFLVTFCSFLPHWVQSFPILLRLHPVHSLSAEELQVIGVVFT